MTSRPRSKQHAPDHAADRLVAFRAWARPASISRTGATFESGGTQLTAGVHYCVRIRAQGDTDTAGTRVYGDYTFLDDAFTYPPNAPATGSVALPTSSDYLSPRAES